MTDDRIRNVWSNGVLVEGQMDTTDPEAEERTTHHHLHRYFSRHLGQYSIDLYVMRQHHMLLHTDYLFGIILFLYLVIHM